MPAALHRFLLLPFFISSSSSLPHAFSPPSFLLVAPPSAASPAAATTTGEGSSDPLLVCARVAQGADASSLPSSHHLPQPFRLVDPAAPGCTALSLSPGHNYRVTLVPLLPDNHHQHQHQQPWKPKVPALLVHLLSSWRTKSSSNQQQPKTITCLATCGSSSSDDRRRTTRTALRPIPPAHLLVAPADLPPEMAYGGGGGGGGVPSFSLLGLLQSMDVPSVPRVGARGERLGKCIRK